MSTRHHQAGRGAADGRPARQQAVAASRAAEAARERRRRTRRGGLVGALSLVLVVALGVGVQAARDGGGEGAAAPAHVTGDGGFVVGQDGAPVQVAVFEDFHCPACGTFEQVSGPVLEELAAQGVVRVAYFPIAFLDRASTDRYSTRAANAAACVVDAEPRAASGFHTALYGSQPPQGGPGLSDDALVSLAVAAGAPEEQVRSCVADETFEPWTREVTDAASRRGIVGTPTVLVEGEPLEDWSPPSLRAAVEAARQP